MNIKRVINISLALAVLLALFAPGASSVKALESRDIVILGTSDIHGNVDNYDYFTDSVPTGSARRGLTKIETYVNNVIASNPNTILIDDGDTIQGTPLAYYFELIDTDQTNPLALAMNYMEYTASTVGNHEFNYGPAVFNKFQSEAAFPLLSANVTGCRDYTFEPYTIKDINGVQVGILGLTPPAVVHWERPENIVDCVFGDAVAAAQTYVPEMRAAGADIIVVAAHSGLDETYGYGREENFVKYLANEVTGIDIILAGHAHAVVASQVINGVLVTEPGYHTRNISDIRVTVSGSGSDWTITSKSSTAPAMGGTAEDPTLLGMMQPYHNATITYINTPIGTATGDFPGGYIARAADGPMADLINQVQTDAAAEAGFPVQASLAALFTDQAQLAAGPIKLKDAYAVYIYDNTLYVIEATGQMIKDELEWTAGYWEQYTYGPEGVKKLLPIPPGMQDYNYDLWSGIEYSIDVTKPVGQRVVELKLDGEPIAMDQVVRVALNNYRATGKFPNAPKLYQSTTEVRQLITDWIMARGTISPSDVFVQNYRLLPPINTWLPSAAGNPVSPADYAGLLWTAFGGNEQDYIFPGLPGTPGDDLNRQEAFYLLVDKALPHPLVPVPNRSILKGYKDTFMVLGWAKDPMAYTIQTGIYVPLDNYLLPNQVMTNADVLSLVHDLLYP